VVEGMPVWKMNDSCKEWDTHTLGILIKNGLDIFCCPQRILRSLTSVDAWNFHVSKLLKSKLCPQPQANSPSILMTLFLPSLWYQT
jgi:hypothetical protein